MRSTGEVMGIAETFSRAFGKAMLAGGVDIGATLSRGDKKTARRAFLSVKDEDKPVACLLARRLRALGYEICATKGTAAAIARARIPVEVINKVNEGTPHIVDALKSRSVAIVVNTTIGAKEVKDSFSLRRQALLANLPYFTTTAAALAVVDALEATRGDMATPVNALQDWATG